MSGPFGDLFSGSFFASTDPRDAANWHNAEMSAQQMRAMTGYDGLLHIDRYARACERLITGNPSQPVIASMSNDRRPVDWRRLMNIPSPMMALLERKPIWRKPWLVPRVMRE